MGILSVPEDITKEDTTLAGVLKPHGYVTGQSGKNHLGDRNDMLPTNYGFDEWFGNLYHLNAKEELENERHPEGFDCKIKFGPLGVLCCRMSEEFDDTEGPPFGQPGNWVCKDTGPLTRIRMETIDDEVFGQAIYLMGRAEVDDKPFWTCRVLVPLPVLV